MTENSPLHNTMASLLCWGGAMFASYNAQFMRERSALNIPEPDLPTSAFRERFGRWIFLPISILTWTIIYIALCGNMKQCLGKNKASKLIDHYPGWSYLVSVFHGGFILPFLFIAATLAHCWESNESFSEGQWMTTFLVNGTYGTAESLSRILIEQINCAVIAYLLKDFCGVHPKGLDAAFLGHHIFAIAGCTLCLYFPTLIGIIAFNTVQCEFASALFCLSILFPSSMTHALYFVIMAISNILTIPIFFIVWKSSVNNFLKQTYGVLSVLLVLLRCGGWLLALRKGCCTNSDNSSSDVDSVKDGEKKSVTKVETKKDQ